MQSRTKGFMCVCMSVAASWLFASVASPSSTQPSGQQICYEGTATPDPNDPKCVKGPVSMPCLDTTNANNGSNSYQGSNNAQCGTKRKKWRFTRCYCGYPQADNVCGGA
jgi:hypothetical protein